MKNQSFLFQSNFIVLFIAVLSIGCFDNKAFDIPEPDMEGAMLVDDYLFVSELGDYVKRTLPEDYETFFETNPKHIASKFQFPVGPPDAKGYYNAQKFGANLHLGDDWNGVGGGNTDLGDTVYSVANGWINIAEDFEGGWGNIVRVIHKMPENGSYDYVESLYAHLDEILIEKNQKIKIGDVIGTIGNCNGHYLAHLHLEIRDKPLLPLGAGYNSETEGYLDPTTFIKNN